MIRTANSKNLVMTALFGVLIITAGLGLDGCAKKLPGDELLRMAPADSLFCVRLNNFDLALNALDKYLAGASPVPMGVSMMARSKLAEILGSPDLKGVKTTGNFAVFGWLASDGSSQPTIKDLSVAAVIPVSDHKEFIEGNPNVGEPDGKGISKISGPGMPDMAAKKTGDYVLITRDYDKLAAMGKTISAKSAGLAGTLDEGLMRQALDEPIWAHGNIELVSKTFGEAITAQLKKIKTMISQARAAGAPQPIDPGVIIDVYARILEALLKQTRSVTIAVNPEPEVLRLIETVSAVPGTEMARMFTADETAVKENRLIGYLQDGAAANFAGRVNTPLFKELSTKSVDLTLALAGESMTGEEAAKWKKLVEGAIDSLGGPTAFSFSVDPQNVPPFAARYVLEVKDVEKFNNLIKESAAMMSDGGILGFYKKLGLEARYEFKQAVESYKGVSIDSASLVMKAADPNSPEGQMIERMYGGGLDYRWGVVDGMWVCALGGDADAEVRELIDLVKAGGPKETADEIKTALKLLPDAEKGDFMVIFNYVRMFRMMPAMSPIPVSIPDIPTKSNFVLAGSVADAQMVIRLALPKEHLTEMVSALGAMQQQMMQQMQQQQMRKGP